MLSQEVQNELQSVVAPDRFINAPEICACYSYDAFLAEAVPDVVLFPVTTEEVAAIMKIASKHTIPVTARGAGTSVCGAPVPIQKGIVLCFTKMDKILEVNTRDRYAVVQPGVINGTLQQALAPEKYFYPPDPGSMSFSTLGGNVSLNAGGPRCLKYGVTADYVLSMQVVLPTGKVIRFGSKNVKDVTGYKMTPLFCGSEGTLGLVTEITLRVVPLPETTQTIMVHFDDLDQSARSVSDIIGAGILPVALELMDNKCINMLEDGLHAGLPRDAAGILIIEVDGIHEACDRERERIVEIVKKHGATSISTAKSEEERNHLWQARRAAYGVFAKIAPDIISEDVTVPVSKVPVMIKQIHEVIEKFHLVGGVLAHAGDGNMHPLVCTDRANTEEWGRVCQAYREIYAMAASFGGTLSGEHGIGLAKAEYLPLVMDEDSREFMGQLKHCIDPQNILNPGKFV